MSTPVPAGLRARVEGWIGGDPDPADRDELASLLAAGDTAGLEQRFAGRPRFGTAGLRAPVGAGPSRMNRAVVRAATAGVCEWLSARGGAGRRVVVGCDARHRSADLAGETAAVLAAAGFHVDVLDPAQPTPLLAFAVRHLGAVAGVMITASHNPPADNGYKLYLDDGAQVFPPADSEIEACIARVAAPGSVPVAAGDDTRIRPAGPGVRDAYLAAVSAAAPAPAGADGLRIVHTALHGVSTRLFDAALEAGGYPAALHVAAQADPDPDFPTTPFPNPEEPGAMDLALGEARRSSADVVIAHDPDADRLAVAVPEPSRAGGWRVLSGDELGALLGAAVIDGEVGPAPGPGEPVVASTVVSSTLLAAVAAASGVRWVETLTGFKWIARAADGVAGGRLVFGYEEALGYMVGDAVRDKDGIGAALAVLALAASDRAAGRRCLLDRLDGLEARHGVHATSQVSRRLGSPAAAAAVTAGLRSAPPAALGGDRLVSVEDLAAGGRLPAADVVVLRLEGARVVVRPSGTEPKLKAYLQVVEPAGGDLAGARARAARRLGVLEAAVADLIDRAAPGGEGAR